MKKIFVTTQILGEVLKIQLFLPPLKVCKFLLLFTILGRASSARSTSPGSRGGGEKKRSPTVSHKRSRDPLLSYLHLMDKSLFSNLKLTLISRWRQISFAIGLQPCGSVCVPRWLCALAVAAPSRWEKKCLNETKCERELDAAAGTGAVSYTPVLPVMINDMSQTTVLHTILASA